MFYDDEPRETRIVEDIGTLGTVSETRIVEGVGTFVPLTDAPAPGGLSVENFVLAYLPANTWTTMPAVSLTEIHFWQVRTATGDLVTESFEYRDQNGALELFSLRAQYDLQFRLMGI